MEAIVAFELLQEQDPFKVALHEIRRYCIELGMPTPNAFMHDQDTMAVTIYGDWHNEMAMLTREQLAECCLVEDIPHHPVLHKAIADVLQSNIDGPPF